MKREVQRAIHLLQDAIETEIEYEGLRRELLNLTEKMDIVLKAETPSVPPYQGPNKDRAKVDHSGGRNIGGGPSSNKPTQISTSPCPSCGYKITLI